MGKHVSRLPPGERLTPEQALNHALAREKEDGVTDVLVVGKAADGSTFVYISDMPWADAMWLAEYLKDWIREV